MAAIELPLVLTDHYSDLFEDPLLCLMLPRITVTAMTQGNLGEGLAFTIPERIQNQCILNSPADQMDLPWFVRFNEWLQIRGHEYSERSFVPRHLFGAYIKDQIEAFQGKFCEDQPLGLKFHFGKIDGVTADALDGRLPTYTVSIEGKELCYDSLALAPGTILRTDFDHLKSSPRYSAHPYDVSALESLCSTNPESISLIGSGSAMMDCVRILEEAFSFQGTYNIISSSTQLPWVFDMNTGSEEAFKQVTLSKLKATYLRWHPEEVANWRELYIAECANHITPAVSELAFIMHFSNQIVEDSPLKKILGDQHAADFLRFLYERAAAITAPDTWAVFDRVKREGRMSMVEGRVIPASSSVKEEGDALCLAVQLGETISTFETPGAINCAPLNRNYQNAFAFGEHQMISAEFAESYIEFDEHGIMKNGAQAEMLGVVGLGGLVCKEHWSAEFFMGYADQAAWALLMRAIYQQWCRTEGVEPKLSSVDINPNGRLAELIKG